MSSARPRPWAIVLGVVALAAANGACGGDDADTTPGTAIESTAATEPTGATESSAADTEPGGGTPAPARGGTLRVALATDIGSVNPTQIPSNNRDVIWPVVESLLYFDKEQGRTVGWLAESYDVNDDATEFTFHLREGITFSNGEAFDAHVVKANFDDYIANATSILGTTSILLQSAAYVGTDVVDDYTVTMRFGQPNAGWPTFVSMTAYGIVAPETLAVPWDQRFDHVIGTGPFTIESFDPNGDLVLVRRDGYSSHREGSANTGDAYLDGIVYTIVPESSVRTGILTSGQVDVVTSLGPADIELIRDSGLQVVTQVPGRNAESLVAIPKDRPPLDDARVRQAVLHAIDTAQIRDTLLTPEWGLPTSIFTTTMVGHQDNSDLLEFDPALSQALLDEAGWTPAADGIRERDGERLTVSVFFVDRGNSWTRPMLELIASQLADVGVDFEIAQLTEADYIAALFAPDPPYDYLFASTNGNLDADSGLRGSFTISPQNILKMPDDELQGLIAEQAALTDPDQRLVVLRQIEEYLLGGGVVVPLINDLAAAGVGDDVHGLELEADSFLPNMLEVWIG